MTRKARQQEDGWSGETRCRGERALMSPSRQSRQSRNLLSLVIGYINMTKPNNLREKLDNLPASPGVYLMKDSQGKILYVGKGKDLRKRVLSYFRQKDHLAAKTLVLVNKVSDLEFIVTGSEKEKKCSNGIRIFIWIVIT